MHHPPHPLSYREALQAWLREDWGTQDWTTAAVPVRPMKGRIIAKSDLVLAGLPVALEVLAQADASIRAVPRADDGQRVPKGTVVLDLEGPSHGILLAERVMLNLLQRLSGTATLTRAFVDTIEGTGCRVLDTRKTTPGLKLLEKYAVRCGGGVNHRLTLGDGVLLKENHLAAAGGIRPAVEAARAAAPNLVRIEVEVERLDQLEQCLALDAVDGVLLDNMDLETTRKAVAMRNASGRKVFLEASGNMTLERARPVAETGVDFISVGALTHSAMAADLSLRLDR
ncbi:MAG: carboxylating nicotinate-nucleotide diphosphorylase [Holophagaceae bacterium]